MPWGWVTTPSPQGTDLPICLSSGGPVGPLGPLVPLLGPVGPLGPLQAQAQALGPGLVPLPPGVQAQALVPGVGSKDWGDMTGRNRWMTSSSPGNLDHRVTNRGRIILSSDGVIETNE